MSYREQSILREENARYLVCRNEKCPDFEMKWRVNDEGEPSICDECLTEGEEAR